MRFEGGLDGDGISIDDSEENDEFALSAEEIPSPIRVSLGPTFTVGVSHNVEEEGWIWRLHGEL